MDKSAEGLILFDGGGERTYAAVEIQGLLRSVEFSGICSDPHRYESI